MREPQMTYSVNSEKGHRARCKDCPWASVWFDTPAKRDRKADIHMNTHRAARGLPRIEVVG